MSDTLILYSIPICSYPVMLVHEKCTWNLFQVLFHPGSTVVQILMMRSLMITGGRWLLTEFFYNPLDVRVFQIITDIFNTWDWFFLISLICYLLVPFFLYIFCSKTTLFSRSPSRIRLQLSELRERVAAHRGHLIMIFHERHSIIYYQFIISSEHSKIQISSLLIVIIWKWLLKY